MTGGLSVDHMPCVTLLVSLIKRRKPVVWISPLQIHKTLVQGVLSPVWALMQWHAMSTNARWSKVDPFNFLSSSWRSSSFLCQTKLTAM